jgi:hypothetical protein
MMRATQRAALARTDARSDHAVLDLLVLFDQAKRTKQQMTAFKEQASSLAIQWQ